MGDPLYREPARRPAGPDRNCIGACQPAGLPRLGFDLAGGVALNFGGGGRLGTGEDFVIEGDEYDTAFFDKGPKFLHYRPVATVLTSIEFDHADIYRDLEHVKSAFRRLVDGLPPDSLLVACEEDSHISEVIAGAALTVRRYGRREGSHWRLGSITVDPPWTTFDVLQAGRRFARFRTRLIGTHNLLNALAAIAVADHLGLSAAALANALATFEGIRRRQEIRGEKRGIVVMDDFAHHPTAVRETIAAVKDAFPGRRIIAVFEPRTNTTRRNVFQKELADSFWDADAVVLAQIARLEQLQKEFTAELEDPETYNKPGRAVVVNRELSAVAEFEHPSARAQGQVRAFNGELVEKAARMIRDQGRQVAAIEECRARLGLVHV